MAEWHGKDGQLKFDSDGGGSADAILNLRSFSLGTSSSVNENRYKGKTHVGRTAGFKDATLTVELDTDTTDTAQALLVEGARVEVEIYPEDETATGVQKITGDMIVTDVDKASPEDANATTSVTLANADPDGLTVAAVA